MDCLDEIDPLLVVPWETIGSRQAVFVSIIVTQSNRHWICVQSLPQLIGQCAVFTPIVRLGSIYYRYVLRQTTSMPVSESSFYREIHTIT